jgi:hypothetical protein
MNLAARYSLPLPRAQTVLTGILRTALGRLSRPRENFSLTAARP